MEKLMSRTWKILFVALIWTQSKRNGKNLEKIDLFLATIYRIAYHIVSTALIRSHLPQSLY